MIDTILTKIKMRQLTRMLLLLVVLVNLLTIQATAKLLPNETSKIWLRRKLEEKNFKIVFKKEKEFMKLHTSS